MDRQTVVIDFLGGEIARMTIENAALKAVINELNNELESLKGGVANGNKDI